MAKSDASSIVNPALRIFTSWTSSRPDSPLFKHPHTALPALTAPAGLENLMPTCCRAARKPASSPLGSPGSAYAGAARPIAVETPSTASSILITHPSSMPWQFRSFRILANVPRLQRWRCQCAFAQHCKTFCTSGIDGSADICSDRLVVVGTSQDSVGVPKMLFHSAVGATDLRLRGHLGRQSRPESFEPGWPQRRNQAGSRSPNSLQQMASVPQPYCASEGTTLALPPLDRCTAWMPGFFASCSSRLSRPS
jgi:hypothetical protein